MAYFSRNIPISIIQGFFGIGNDPNYPLVNCYITMERSTMLLMGKSTISMVIFNSYVSHYQRLNLHFPMVFLWFSYGFPMVFLWFTRGYFYCPWCFPVACRPGLISYSAVVEPDALRRAAALNALDGQGPARSSKLFQAVPSCHS